MTFRVLLRGRNPLRRPRLFRWMSNNQPQSSSYPSVQILRPVIWSVGAISVTYYLAASWEVYGEIESFKNSPIGKNVLYQNVSSEILAALGALSGKTAEMERRRDDLSIYNMTSIQALRDGWSALRPVEKASWTAIATCTAVYIPSKTIASIQQATFHLPSSKRNWTLLTSTFGHGSPLHLFVNMYVLNNFTVPVSRSYTFQNSAPHATAFYLSSGILATLAYHLNSVVKPAYRLIPCLGASGAIYALLGVFGMSYPDARLGIIFLPFSFPAQQAMAGLAAFELYGTVFGTRLGLAHVSHLAGLITGVGYVYFDGGKNVWRNLKGKLHKARQAKERRQQS